MDGKFVVCRYAVVVVLVGAGVGNGRSPASIWRRYGSRNGGSARVSPRCSGVFVGGEAGAVGRNLEEHAARLAEVDRVEVEAVDHWRHLKSRLVEPPAPGDVCLVGRRAKRHMVNAADADATHARLVARSSRCTSVPGPPLPT